MKYLPLSSLAGGCSLCAPLAESSSAIIIIINVTIRAAKVRNTSGESRSNPPPKFKRSFQFGSHPNKSSAPRKSTRRNSWVERIFSHMMYLHHYIYYPRGSNFLHLSCRNGYPRIFARYFFLEICIKNANLFVLGPRRRLLKAFNHYYCVHTTSWI